jgi:hypothetical protein
VMTQIILTHHSSAPHSRYKRRWSCQHAFPEAAALLSTIATKMGASRTRSYNRNV